MPEDTLCRCVLCALPLAPGVPRAIGLCVDCAQQEQLDAVRPPQGPSVFPAPGYRWHQEES